MIIYNDESLKNGHTWKRRSWKKEGLCCCAMSRHLGDARTHTQMDAKPIIHASSQSYRYKMLITLAP